jgi:hypothetical protein
MGAKLRPCADSTRFSESVRELFMLELRYPGHDTWGCFSSSKLCRGPLNSTLSGYGSAARLTSPNNLGEETLTAFGRA